MRSNSRERDVAAGVEPLCAALGIRIMRTNAGSGYRFGPGGKTYRIRGAPKGWADFTGYLPDGRVILIEVKSATGTATLEQIDRIADVNRCGGVGMIASDLARLADDLKQIVQGGSIRSTGAGNHAIQERKT